MSLVPYTSREGREIVLYVMTPWAILGARPRQQRSFPDMSWFLETRPSSPKHLRKPS